MTAVHPSTAGRELSKPPLDGVSNLRFSNHSDRLLVSSWDKSVRLYDAGSDALLGEFMHGGAVLDCCFHDDTSGFSASADHTVRRYVFGSGKEDILGRHDAPVRCVEYSYAAESISMNYKCVNIEVIIETDTVSLLEPTDITKRGASGQERTLVGTYPQPERVYSLSLVGNRLVVATAGRHVNVYDLRNMSQPEQRRESSLKYQTRCVRCYPNGTDSNAPIILLACREALLCHLTLAVPLPVIGFMRDGYALSSVEGRVAMEFFDLSEASQAKNIPNTQRASQHYHSAGMGDCLRLRRVTHMKREIYHMNQMPSLCAT
ncbi:hypothetical protein QJS10_CPB17g02335 [Acorus calamus]|uniref:Mitotic checkpoint protein BUB3.1 n=1 Tax=Acorus calamus TaxID=4465 RepID=A0AAV9CT39_ACOCL|nr:hypothetical protein QJS10_CPB17g02335 [Acorus calamus]